MLDPLKTLLIHTNTHAITSYLKLPAVTNNMGDNAVSSPSYGLGFITSCVFINASIYSYSRSCETQKPCCLPENVFPLSLSHLAHPLSQSPTLTGHLPHQCHHNIVLYCMQSSNVCFSRAGLFNNLQDMCFLCFLK